MVYWLARHHAGKDNRNSSMKRDTASYLNLTIRIVRGSPTHLALLRDAEERGVKQLPMLAGIRLGDYYEMKEQRVSFTFAQNHAEVAPDHIAELVENIDAASEAWPR